MNAVGTSHHDHVQSSERCLKAVSLNFALGLEEIGFNYLLEKGVERSSLRWWIRGGNARLPEPDRAYCSRHHGGGEAFNRG